MSDIARDPADEDRLPWLEAVADEGADDGVSVGKLAALIVAALVALGIVIGGVWLLRSRTAPAPTTDPKLIAAQAGDYKVKPDNPGGMKVEGKGDSAFATSEGAEANGKIDTNALPETPMKGTKTTPAASDTPGKATASPTVALPKGTAPLVAKSPIVVKTPSLAGAGVLQLGAYGSQAKADTGWDTLSKRYSYLATLKKSIAPAEVGGATVYRLRVDAGTQAGAICAKLKAAGENCIQAN